MKHASSTRANRVYRPLLSVLLGMVVGAALVTAGAIAHEDVNCPTHRGETPNCRGDEHDNFVDGTDGYDDITAKVGADHVHAKPHGDHIHGDFGTDLLEAGKGDDAVRGDDQWDSFTRVLDPVLWGLHGQDGNDNIRGGDGGDTLSGGDASDYLNGGADGEHDHCKGHGGDDVWDNCHMHGADDVPIAQSPPT